MFAPSSYTTIPLTPSLLIVHLCAWSELLELVSRRPFIIARAFAKTMTYTKRYGGSGDAKTQMMATTELREALTQFEAFNDGEVVKLQQFEMAQLANLMQADSEAEEAIALIPSLGSRFTEEDIENILAIVQKQQQQARIAF
ncbi:unnamed protein product [Choristocarpus tenellus]